LLNAPEPPKDRKALSGYRLAVVDASKIALHHHLGDRTQPFINTAMIGAFARIMQIPPLDTLAEAIEKEIPVKTRQNVDAARQAYEEVLV
jgi:pyruvate ferredoxin oxidoreductase gamma subunit/2-oxoisovalerate ferredoxin oxidoreductase gamma subunit